MVKQIILHGWLNKKSVILSEWKKLYFILFDNGDLYGYRNKPRKEKLDNYQHFYSLDNSQLVVYDKPNKFFILICLNIQNKIYDRIFYHEQEFFRNNWVKAIAYISEKKIKKKANFPTELCLHDLENEPELAKYDVLKIIGNGAFGTVILVHEQCTENYYALKVSKKSNFANTKKRNNFISEMNTLKSLIHPFIIKLLSTYQNSTRLFIFLEFSNGGDLLFQLNRNKRFSEERTKFYAAEIVLALIYLHRLDIIFRDLKVSNVLIDGEGHIKIVDFGLCRRDTNYRKRCNSFCGTLDYLAPEIIKRQEYWYAVDWWCFGIIIYECLNGKKPFIDAARNQLLQKILKTKIDFIYTVSTESKKFVSDLLIKDPEVRLGGGPKGSDEIKNHIYFFETDWDAVYDKKIKPPFVPILSSITDTKYFRQTFLSNDASIGSLTNKISIENSEDTSQKKYYS